VLGTTGVLALVGVVAWLGTAAELGLGPRQFLDLQVYLAGGRALLDGGHHLYTLHVTSLHLPFTYPPFAAAVFAPLSVVPAGLVQVLWSIVAAYTIVATVEIGSSVLGLNRRSRWALAIAIGGVASLVLQPIQSGLGLGQVDTQLMLLVMVDLLCVRGRARGVLVGVASAIKLTPLFFLLYFVVTRDWRALRTSAVTFVAITGMTWAFLPRISSHYFLHVLGHPGVIGGLGTRANQAWAGILNRAPFHGSTWGWIVLGVVTTVLATALAALVVRRCPLQAVVALAFGSLLVSPISWSHHWCWIVLLPIIAWQQRADRLLLACNVVVLGVAAVAAFRYFGLGASRAVASDALVVLTTAWLSIWLQREVAAHRRARRSLGGDASTHEGVARAALIQRSGTRRATGSGSVTPA
jgi:alpha-1,2-mannosyltransferase